MGELTIMGLLTALVVGFFFGIGFALAQRLVGKL